MSEQVSADQDRADQDGADQDGADQAGGGGTGTGTEPPFRYNARMAGRIELAWQDRWEAEGTFRAPNPVGPLSPGFDRVAGRPKFYMLDMFAYPSGAGLHVGHAVGYVGTDVYARFLRMTGYAVLHPYGYDAFGLPAEQYAISTGQHPAVATARNIEIMRAQLRRLGLGHDAAREIVTTDPGYYRWTQWIFLRLFGSWFDPEQGRARPVTDLVAGFEAGTRQPSGQANPSGLPWAELDELTRRKVVNDHRLAYIAEELVNWCPGLGTVLASEEVTADGRSQVGNFPVFRRPLRQWMLRISAYAERLVAGLDTLDWPEPIKVMQRNWIGISDGAAVRFDVPGRPGAALATSITVFTTRPDTLPGATFLVLAPEHPQAGELIAAAWPDGTPQGWKFATDTTPVAAAAAYREQAAASGERQRAGHAPVTGVFTGSHAINPVTGARMPVFLADYVLMGYGTGAIMAVPAHDDRDLAFAREFGLPVTEVLSSEGDYSGWSGTGIELAGAGVPAAIEAVTGWLEKSGRGSRQRTCRLRDWLFSRQRYWGEPFPIVYDEAGLPVALPDDQLPVTLPELTEFRAPEPDGATGEPVPPLARARDWAVVELDLGDGPRSYRRELNVMPQWAGSCWYYLRYLDPRNDQALVDPRIERYWMVPDGATSTRPGEGGVDLYVGGAEHAVLHLLYARFWHMVLFDLGHVSTAEPFRRLLNQGMIQADAFTDARGFYVPAAEVTTGTDGSPCWHGQPVTRRIGKMGKSLKNGVSPDDMYAAYGADTLRMYEMAIGPMEAERPWQTDDVVGVYRFLQRLWRNLIDEQTGALTVDDGELDAGTARQLHDTVSAVRGLFDGLRFNIVVARLQELNNLAQRVVAARGTLPRALAEPLVLMVAPLAPHIAEELWSRLGHDGSVCYAPFPEPGTLAGTAPMVVVPVRVDGKVRFRIETPPDADEELTSKILKEHPDFARYVGQGGDGRPVERMVVVPGRIVNVVTVR